MAASSSKSCHPPLPPLPGLRIASEETELRRQVKAAGASWDATCKLWRLPLATIRKLKLQQRIAKENAWIWTGRHIHIWIYERLVAVTKEHNLKLYKNRMY